jgi:hypothetical protein
MLLEVASADHKRRVELVVGYELATLADFEGILREAESRGDDASEQLAAVATRRASVERYAQRHDARTRRWQPNEKQLADKHVNGEGYLDFRMAHHFVHGSTFASQQRYSPRGDVVIIGGPAASQDWTRGALLSASQSMVFAVRGVCRILGWPEPPEVPGLLTRIDQIARTGGGRRRVGAPALSGVLSSRGARRPRPWARARRGAHGPQRGLVDPTRERPR